jgi:hypothetical protein
MATYDLAFHTRLDGVVVLQTFVETGKLAMLSPSLALGITSTAHTPFYQRKTTNISDSQTKATSSLTTKSFDCFSFFSETLTAT